MNTATMSMNEAIQALVAGHTNDMAAQALAIHRQRDRAEAVFKARIAELEGQLAEKQEKIVAQDALLSERAVAAEQHAFDDLAGSVLAEEAQAAAAASAESEGEVIEVSDGEDEASASSASSASSAPRVKRGGRPMVGKIPENLTREQELKMAYDFYHNGGWASSYKKKMPAECLTLDAQAKWCLDVAYPAFLAKKTKKNKEATEAYERKKAAKALAASMGGGGSSSE